jgi:hypothetical protein
MTTALERTATFLLMLNHDRDAIVGTLKREFPYETEADMHAAVDTAEQRKAKFDSDLRAALDREAIEEEHRG